jgi:hypothetical protein
MAFMNLAPSRAAVPLQPPALEHEATTARRHGTWRRTVFEAAGTFLLLAALAVGVLSIRFSLVLIHGVVP